MLFNLEDIEKCEFCGKKDTKGYRELVTERGFGEMTGTREFCETCFDKYTFMNHYGFTFLKFKDKLFCYKPPHYADFGFRQVISEREINRAFDPDRYNFDRWREEHS